MTWPVPLAVQAQEQVLEERVIMALKPARLWPSALLA
jgi:hypothetical protein